MNNNYTHLGDFPTFNQMSAHNEYLARIADNIETVSDYFGAAIKGMNRNDLAILLFNMKKTGKRYGVHFDKFSTNPASDGTRLYDAVGMECYPSTNVIHSRNDFEDVGPFAYLEVNGYVDEDGEFQVEAIKDYDEDFSRTTRDTWTLFPTHYIKTEIDSSGETIVISDHQFDGSIPEGAAIRMDGSIRPFVAIPKYMISTINNIPMSISGRFAQYNISYQSSLNLARAKGDQYCAQTIQDWDHLRTLFQVAFATRNSGSKMAGCNDYYVQYPASVVENNVERIIIANASANNLIVGSCVSIGNATALNSAQTAGNIDRGQAGMHAKADRVVITKIETYDENNKAVYVDNGGTTFSTASVTVNDVSCPTYISTMQWRTGSCDNVLGACGSPVNNISNKEPYILFGVEMQLGFWEPCGNTVMRVENHIMNPYVCYDCTKLTTGVSGNLSDYTKINYNIDDTNGSWLYISEVGFDPANPSCRMGNKAGATSTNGYADGIVTNDLATLADDTYRELLCGGALNYGGHCGLWLAVLGDALGTSGWDCAARLSASGRCGVISAA